MWHSTWPWAAGRCSPVAPVWAVLLAGLVQGAISGLLTLGLKKFLEWQNARLKGAAAVIVPPAITASTIFAILVSAHTLAGTPALWATLAVPFTVSTSYAILYNLRLFRERAEPDRRRFPSASTAGPDARAAVKAVTVSSRSTASLRGFRRALLLRGRRRHKRR